MDALLNQQCSHVVEGVLYTLAACPRCLGAGYYKDFAYDALGQIVTVAGSAKLKQEILKTLATTDSPFHPEYGAQLKNRIGKAFDPEVAKAIVKSDILQAVQSFMTIQAEAPNLIPSEKVRTILEVRTWVLSSEPRRVYGSVVVENEEASPITLDTKVNL